MPFARAASPLLIARRELALQLRDGRLVMAALALLAALGAALASGWVQFDTARTERARFEATARRQWLDQGERHPHRAAHFGAYVAKPEIALALFEPGLRPFAGQTLWLEAHDRPAFTNVPAQDDLTLQTGLGVASGAAVVQMLGGLLALILGALAIARDRESGVLRLALSQGVPPGRIVSGKLIANLALLAIPLVPVAAAGLIVAVAASPSADRADVAVRALGMAGVDGLLVLAMLIVGLIVSAASRTLRGAVAAAFALWIAGFVLLPRVGTAIAERAAPTPTLAQYQDANAREFDAGFDRRGGYMTQLAALRARTQADYRVPSIDRLPVGFSGIRMKHLDAWSTEVDDRGYARLENVYGRQSDIRLATAMLSPFVAARSASQGFAGMDWAHYQDFLVAAERYRRGFGRQMNDLLEHRVRGDRWETDGNDGDWAQVRPFAYVMPTAGWAARQQVGALIVLLAWVTAAAGALAVAARRMRP